MVRTKQTARGNSAPRPGGMATAKFTGRGRGRGDPEAQFTDDPFNIADEDLPDVLEDADKPKGGEPSTSKSVGKEGEAQTEGQATEEAQAAPEGILPGPIPAPTAPLPGTSTGPTQDPTDDPAQDPTQTPGEVEIKLTQYVKDYRAAGKVWLDTVVQEKEKAYNTLYDRLQQLGTPHKEGLDQADRQQVYNCIKDNTGMFLSQDENVLYIETEEEFEKPKFRFTGEAKEALKIYYDAAHELCAAQTGFAKATQELESKVEDKTVFLSIIQQVRLPSVQIHVRMVEEIEQLEGKTYRELTMSQHLPDAKKIYSNATDQTRIMAAFMYFVLYEQITSLKASRTGCSRDFQCQGTPFKRLVTGKKQPGGPGRSGKQRSKRTLEEVAKLEGDTLAKQTRKSTRTPKSRTGKGKKSK